MLAIKLVIFDLDGTLVNAYPAIVKSFNFTLKQFNQPPVSSRIIKRAVGWGDRHLIRPFVGPKNLNRAMMIYRRHHTVSLKTSTTYLSGARQVLESLKKRGYKLAVASNRPTKFSLIILKCLGARKYFDFVLCGDKLKKAKPHPEILIKILRRFRLKPAEAIFVGDMSVDVLAGQKAQVKTIAVLTGSHGIKDIKPLKPFRIIRNIKELAVIMEDLNNNK